MKYEFSDDEEGIEFKGLLRIDDIKDILEDIKKDSLIEIKAIHISVEEIYKKCRELILISNDNVAKSKRLFEEAQQRSEKFLHRLENKNER